MRDIGLLLREMLEREDLGDVMRLAVIREAWDEVAGGLIRARAVCLQGELLKVITGSHTWAQELHYKEEELKRRIFEKTGVRVGRIIVKVEPEV